MKNKSQKMDSNCTYIYYNMTYTDMHNLENWNKNEGKCSTANVPLTQDIAGAILCKTKKWKGQQAIMEEYYKQSL